MITRRELVKKLELQTAQYFSTKGFATAKCGYILEMYESWRNNIIVKEVADFIDKQKKTCEQKRVPFPLHKYIHHGLSSQACLFNLLGPLLEARYYATLQEIVSLSGLKLGGSVSSAEFEFEDRKVFKEFKGQPTSIDLYLETDRNEKVFVEFKFTESEFGTCSVYEDGDCDGKNPKSDLNSCYLHRIGRAYMVLMVKYGLLAESESCPFTEFYQAYRLLLLALEYNGYFLLIHDMRNPSFLIQADGVERGRYCRFKHLLPPEIANKVFIMSMQKVVTQLENNPDSTEKYRWLPEFKTKYL